MKLVNINKEEDMVKVVKEIGTNDVYFFDSSALIDIIYDNNEMYKCIRLFLSQNCIFISKIVEQEISKNYSLARSHLKSELTKFKQDLQNIKLSSNKLSNEIIRYGYSNGIEKIDGLTIEREIKKLETEIQQRKEEDEKWAYNKLSEVLELCTVLEFKNEQILMYIEEATKRMDNEIPPGYKDHKKKSPLKYNDIFIWIQLREFSKNTSNNKYYFITNDKKDSDCNIQVDEFMRETGNELEILTTNEFIKSKIYDSSIVHENIIEKAIDSELKLYFEEERYFPVRDSIIQYAIMHHDVKIDPTYDFAFVKMDDSKYEIRNKKNEIFYINFGVNAVYNFSFKINNQEVGYGMVKLNVAYTGEIYPDANMKKIEPWQIRSEIDFEVEDSNYSEYFESDCFFEYMGEY